MRTLPFAKGHGTRNDFVIVADLENQWGLSEADVRFLCDRRSGVGGDGILRVIPAAVMPEWNGDPGLWFMDYRNADGGIAEMCGNGLRVFVRFLIENNLAPNGEVRVATRAGERSACPLPGGLIRVTMGRVRLQGDVTVSLDGVTWPATKVNVGNPHAVAFLRPDERLDSLDLTGSPRWQPTEAFPAGTNVEFVDEIGDRDIRLRVFERGAGETCSCGTGVVASAFVHAARRGLVSGSVTVEVPGGSLEVGLADEATLTGPAEIVAHGVVTLPDAG